MRRTTERWYVLTPNGELVRECAGYRDANRYANATDEPVRILPQSDYLRERQSK